MTLAHLRVRTIELVAVAVLAAAAGLVPAAGNGAAKPTYPKAAYVLWPTVAARSAPRASARTLKTLRQFRGDFRPTVLLAVGQRVDRKGGRWIRVSLPMRPNGRFGWVRAAALQLRPVKRRIVIDRSSRLLMVYQGRTRLLTARVAIGRSHTPTPLGRFYVQAGYRAKERWLGKYALETSAYSGLSEWPGGGVVGIHGTPWPQLLGRAVSHGCIRVSNATALRLKRLAQPGTPILIRQ